MSYQKK